MTRHYPVIATIDLSAIRHNCSIIKSRLPDHCLFAAVVKCNAYGHGIHLVLPALRASGVDMLCVAAIHEAEQLRNEGWDKSILLLMPELNIYEGKQKSEVARLLVKLDIRVTAVSREDIRVLSEAAVSLNKKAMIHLMLDTGMSRMGLFEDDLTGLIEETRNVQCVEIEGLYTHFASSHADDKTYSIHQLTRFKTFLEKVRKSGLVVPLIHAANSGAVIDIPESFFNMVRPGIALYGYYPDKELHNKPDLKPAMKVVSFLTLIKKVPAGSYVGYGCTYRTEKDTMIGLVPIGYGDGYDRRLSNSGKMTLDGHEIPVIGRISMDQTIVDLTAAVNSGISVHGGTEIVVIDNNRNAVNSVESLAELIDTIPYEIITHLGDRVLRVV